MDTANTFAIEIHRDANDTISPFGDPNLGQYLKFDRLSRYNDITAIQFELYDKCDDDDEFDRIADLFEDEFMTLEYPNDEQ